MGNRTVEILDSPDMVDFGRKESYALRTQLEKFPFIHSGKIVQDYFRVLYIPKDRIQEVIQDFGQNNQLLANPIIMGLMGYRELEVSGVYSIRQHDRLELRGSGVLIAFIDTGIDYRNKIFCHKDGGTRIKSIWDQSIPGAPPPGFGYGSVYDEAQINAALALPDPYTLVPHRDTVGHGTFLASVAAGADDEPYGSVAPDASFVVVKLRKANAYHCNLRQIPLSQENAYSANDLMMGVEYIREKAHELQMPVAICIGLGGNGSAHDGNNYVEEYLSRIGELPGVCVCVAAGNECIAGHHAQGFIAQRGGFFDLDVQCGESAQVGSGLMVYIWNNQIDRLSVSIASPYGEQIPKVESKPGLIYESHMTLDRSNVVIEYYFPNPRTGSQLTWIRIYTPTPGIWRITVYGDIILDGTFNAWVNITGFCDPSIRFTSPSSFCTVTTPSTTPGVITVGAYSAENMELYEKSSWGPTRLPATAPDISAPGVQTLGTYPDGHGAMSGTSVAAAITAGACALMLEWGIVQRNEPMLNTYLAKAYLIRGSERDAKMHYPNEQWGFGKLNLWNMFMNIW
ncbi:MAG: S8 family peptidase [Clostridiales bacterium]|nr:S8 family peptidase [Clostridiales bacterium]